MQYCLRSAAKKKHIFTEYKAETFTGEAEKRKNEFWVISDLTPQADEKLLKAQNKWRLAAVKAPRLKQKRRRSENLSN